MSERGESCRISKEGRSGNIPGQGGQGEKGNKAARRRINDTAAGRPISSPEDENGLVRQC